MKEHARTSAWPSEIRPAPAVTSVQILNFLGNLDFACDIQASFIPGLERKISSESKIKHVKYNIEDFNEETIIHGKMKYKYRSLRFSS